jgi:hypothetical protein
MEVYDIVEAANKLINHSKGMIVLHRSIKQHPMFKVYKRFTYGIYLVKDGVGECIKSHEISINCPSNEMEDAWKKCDKEFLTVLVDWLSSNQFIELRDGI